MEAKAVLLDHSLLLICQCLISHYNVSRQPGMYTACQLRNVLRISFGKGLCWIFFSSVFMSFLAWLRTVPILCCPEGIWTTAFFLPAISWIPVVTVSKGLCNLFFHLNGKVLQQQCSQKTVGNWRRVKLLQIEEVGKNDLPLPGKQATADSFKWSIQICKCQCSCMPFAIVLWARFPLAKTFMWHEPQPVSFRSDGEAHLCSRHICWMYLLLFPTQHPCSISVAQE